MPSEEVAGALKSQGRNPNAYRFSSKNKGNSSCQVLPVQADEAQEDLAVL